MDPVQVPGCAPEPATEAPPPSRAPGASSLADGVWQHSRQRPETLALEGADGRWSYAELARLAWGVAAELQQLPGWASEAPGGDAPRVGILASRSAGACVAALGAAWAGATYVPLGLKWPEDRLLQVMRRSRLTALLTDAQGAALLSPRLRAAIPPTLCLGAAPDALLPGVMRLGLAPLAAGSPRRPVPPPRPLAPGQTAYILFTSGTTGEPKGVMVPSRAVSHYVPAMARHLRLTPEDRVLDLFELSFDVSVQSLFCTWQAGASLHLLPPERVMNAVAFVRDKRLTFWNSVPSLVTLLMQVKALVPGAMPSLRLTTFGGEQLTVPLVRAWRQAAPHSEIHNMYGPTEATVTCLGQRLEEPLPVRPGSDALAIGRPLEGCELAVFDDAGQPLPPGQSGELAVAGVQLATGYLDAPALTAARFVHRQGRRWYLTGDLALQDEAGRYHCLGRMDHQVKVRGHRVELEEVEAHLRPLAGHSLVAAVPWPWQGAQAQGLVAFVAGDALDEAQTLHALRQRLPAYMLPTRLVCLPQMPLNANGKVDRPALRRLLEQAGP